MSLNQSNDKGDADENTRYNSIMVESEPRRMLSGQTQPITEHTSALEESMYKLQGMLANIGRTQK